MRKPNTKLEADLDVYEDNHILKQVCRNGSNYLDSVHCLVLWEIKGPQVLARWVCRDFPGAHVNFWESPAAVIQHELKGESGCVYCRELAREETVDAATFKADLKVQNAAIEKQEKRSKKIANRSQSRYIPPSDRYTL